MQRVVPVLPSLGLLAATLVVPWTHFGSTLHPGDVQRYHLLAEQMLDGLVPYRDFFLEYPPGMIPLVLVPEIAGHGLDDYIVTFQWLVVCLTLATIVATALACRALGGLDRQVLEATCFVAIAPALLGAVFFLRSDILPSLLMMLAIIAMLRRRDGTAAALLGIGAATKLFPVLLLPLLVARAGQRQRHRAVLRTLGIFTAFFMIIAGPLALVAPGGVGFSFRTQLTRALEIESLGATILLAAHQVGVGRPDVHAGLSYELEGAVPSAVGALQTVIMVAVLVLVCLSFCQSSRDDSNLVLAVAATIATVIALNKVLSPQYLVWLIPVISLLAGRVGVVARCLLATALVLTIAYFPDRFREFRLLGSAVWIVLARDLVLLALAALLVLALRGQRKAVKA